jgi:hypothetical protein
LNNICGSRFTVRAVFDKTQAIGQANFRKEIELMKEKLLVPDPDSVSPAHIPTVPAPVPILMPIPREDKEAAKPAQNGSRKDSDPSM